MTTINDHIREFRGEYSFLSNFHYHSITYENIIYATNEHFFQAMKRCDIEYRKAVAMAKTPGIAKRMGGNAVLRPNWNIIRVEVMSLASILKYEDPHLRKLLLATYPKVLEEGNYWHDTYWGIGLKTGIGENMLGKILMALREYLINGQMTLEEIMARC